MQNRFKHIYILTFINMIKFLLAIEYFHSKLNVYTLIKENHL